MMARMLRLLEARDGDRVLEIGTGSGYSTALLRELVGPRGGIVSIDVDTELTSRAAVLLPDVRFVTADGRDGCAAAAPYDRVIAWASATELPLSWLEQTRPGALLVVPMRDSASAWVSRYRRTFDGALEDKRIAGSFIPLTAQPFKPWESD